jgi:integrase/recombinase XerD
LLAAPDRSTRLGRRDHAMLILACQTGLRVSELIGLRRADIDIDIDLGAGPHCRCTGKGRKDRATPLTRQTVAALRVWLADHDGGPDDALFTTSRGQPLSRDAVAKMITKHAARATVSEIVPNQWTQLTLTRRADGSANSMSGVTLGPSRSGMRSAVLAEQ